MDPSLQDKIEQAYGQLKEGYFEDAIKAFSECLLLEPAESCVHYGRGMAHFQLKEWSKAALDFKKAAELDPANPENWLGLGMSLAVDNKIYEAIDIFETLLTEKPQFVRGHIQLAELYYRLGVITKGHRQLDAAMAQRPTLVERRTIEQLKKEQTTLDKRRHYRPDFEELRKQNRLASGGFLKKIKGLFGR